MESHLKIKNSTSKSESKLNKPENFIYRLLDIKIFQTFVLGIMGFGHSYWSTCSVAELRAWLSRNPANLKCLTKQLSDRIKLEPGTASKSDPGNLDLLSGETKTDK